MKTTIAAKFCMVALAVAAVALISENTFAQKTKGKTRDATTKQLMKGLVAPNCSAVSKSLKEPEVNWESVALQAALLNESSYLLMDDGRCPDKDWATGAKTVREASKALLESAEKKDLEGAQKAFKTLTSEGCATCHKAHKPK